jgi:hypothetical protein
MEMEKTKFTLFQTKTRMLKHKTYNTYNLLEFLISKSLFIYLNISHFHTRTLLAFVASTESDKESEKKGTELKDKSIIQTHQVNG